MVRSAGGKRSTGRDMTKSLVKSHVTGQTARHGSPVSTAAKTGATGTALGAKGKRKPAR